MKKSLIALGVLAGIIGTAQAQDTTSLYGSIKFTVNAFDKNAKTRANNTENVLDLKRSASFGIKGTEDLSGGLQAFYKFDFGTSDAGVSKSNDLYLGLKGDFGTLTLGRQKVLLSDYVKYNDNFNSVFFTGKDSNIGRYSKIVKYVSPSMGGVQLGGSMTLDGDNTVIKDSDSKGIDAWEAGIGYEANGIKVGAGYYVQDKGKGKREFMGGSGGYKNDMFKAGVGYIHVSSKLDYYNLGAEYYLGQNTFRAGFAAADFSGGKEGDFAEYALGYQYNLSDRTYLWAEGAYKDYCIHGRDSDSKMVVGIKHKF